MSDRVYCPFHPDDAGGCGCALRRDMVHSGTVSFYPLSRLVRIHARLYVFSYSACKSLLLTAHLADCMGVALVHCCANPARGNLYAVFQYVDANGFRYGLGYALDVIRGGRTALAHLRCAQRAVRAFLGRRRAARDLAAAMGVLSVAPLPSDLLHRLLCLSRGAL